MLKYNLARMFSIRGVGRPSVFLSNSGFSRNIAARLAAGKVDAIPLKNIEQLCLALKCTPNDLMEWTPSKPELLNENPPLAKLMGNPANLVDVRALCSDIPVDMMHEFAKKINEIKKEFISGQ